MKGSCFLCRCRGRFASDLPEGRHADYWLEVRADLTPETRHEVTSIDDPDTGDVEPYLIDVIEARPLKPHERLDKWQLSALLDYGRVDAYAGWTF